MSVFRSKFFQAVLILVIVFLLFRFGIRPAAPWSVFTLYMFVALIAVLVYVSSNGDSWRSFVAPIRAVVVDDSKLMIRIAVMIVLPLLFGYYAYTQPAARVEAAARDSAPEGRAEPQEVRRRRRGDLHQELHVLPRRQPGRQRPLRPRLQPAPSQLHRPRDHRDAPGGVSLLADRQGRPGPAEGVHALELGYARRGGPAERGRYWESPHLPPRRAGPPAPPLGVPCRGPLTPHPDPLPSRGEGNEGILSPSGGGGEICGLLSPPGGEVGALLSPPGGEDTGEGERGIPRVRRVGAAGRRSRQGQGDLRAKVPPLPRRKGGR